MPNDIPSSLSLGTMIRARAVALLSLPLAPCAAARTRASNCFSYCYRYQVVAMEMYDALERVPSSSVPFPFLLSPLHLPLFCLPSNTTTASSRPCVAQQLAASLFLGVSDAACLSAFAFPHLYTERASPVPSCPLLSAAVLSGALAAVVLLVLFPPEPEPDGRCRCCWPGSLG